MRPLQNRLKAYRIKKLSAGLARTMVLDLIERRPSDAGAKRVERILELLVIAEENRAKIHSLGWKRIDESSEEVDAGDWFHSPAAGFECVLPRLRFVDGTIEECNQRYRDALRELQTLLIRYQWRPTIQDRFYDSLEQGFLWESAKPAVTEENRAVQFLIEQLDSTDGSARICRFRKCRECAAWFYALKNDQLSCRESCRKSFASHSEEFKKKRRDYMRTTYRPQEKQRSENALKLVKGTSIATEKSSDLRPHSAERKSKRNESQRNIPGGGNSPLKVVAKQPRTGRSTRGR